MSKPGPDKGNGGRPRLIVDQKIFDNLCKIQCTLAEIAAFFDCSEDTIEKRVKEWTEDKQTFKEYYQVKRQAGNVSLRRIQFRLARKNVAMAIWLGKQYLGQKDRQHIETENKIETLDIKLTPEEQEAYKKRMQAFLGADLSLEDN